ncbi:MAG: hypothetical protein DRO90_01805 [Candidatus Altiarchaeales archaeon]|nr:MAG: hypothetical protein DRO95_03100 [Candidatus Altiarchaeales archaeon]RLI94583.1 MAG: hypothetical protein DRO90_01805 [Candidatus Altiarchaeales archaeon]HDO82761.1 hypothetical protein [Candidatus Altiarchaeales archaeon]HEX55410.1 hypothetical protein [Candidatus Altiarchaeales archaeon]
MIGIERQLRFAFLSMGFISIIAQVVLLREFLTIFGGNELSIGIMLGNWLLLVAIGSISIKFLDRFNFHIREFAIFQFIIPVIIPIQILIIRIFPKVIGLIRGEVVGIGTIFSSTFIIFMPLCIILGFQFSLACRIYSGFEKRVKGIAHVYILEAIGSMIAGLLFTYLIQYLNPFQIIFISGILCILSSSMLLYLCRSRALILSTFVLIFLLFLTPEISSRINFSSLQILWDNELIDAEDSIYGNLVVLGDNNQYDFYENGILLFTTQDTAINEEIIHFPMLEHPEPRNILLIGGGVGGLLGEILKYGVDKVTYIEIDPKLIEISRRYIPENNLDDRRVETIFTDGRFFIKNSNERYDVIIVNLPEPSNAQLNRFYTVEFFHEVHEALNDDGMVSISIPFSESYVSEEMRILGGSIYRTLSEIFPDVKVIPGERTILLGCKSEGILTYNTDLLGKRINERGIMNKWVNIPYINYKLSPHRINFTLNSLRSNAEINEDFRPIGYYYYTLIWSSISGSEIMEKAFYVLIIIIIAVILILNKNRNAPVLFAILTTGFAGMVLEVSILIAFQAVYGYLYHKMAMIIATFMMGLAVGGSLMNRLMNRYMRRMKNPVNMLVGIEFLIVLYSLFIPITFIEISQYAISQYADTIFPILMLIAGSLVGLEFPLASEIYLERNKEIGKTAGVIYGSDLFGAFLGSLLSASLLIPLMGIINVCILVAILNFVSGIALGIFKT